MKKFIYIFLISNHLSIVAHAIDTNAVKFFPLKVGNYWVYNSFCACPNPVTARYWVRVADTLTTNGHRYYRVQTGFPGYGTTEEYLRVDSSTGSIRKLVTSGSCQWLSNEQSRDSLYARFGDSSLFQCGYQWYRCVDDSSFITKCGQFKRMKVYFWSNYFEAGGTRAFARDIGFISSYDLWHGAYLRIDLLGFIINGTLCGDTSLTGINIVSSEVPGRFSLYQNYPNPFNPVTKIRFDISPVETGLRPVSTKLVLFDILGREIATLVNEPLQPGVYEVQWDATNYPSGIYFYKLIAGDFSETKKMIFLR